MLILLFFVFPIVVTGEPVNATTAGGGGVTTMPTRPNSFPGDDVATRRQKVVLSRQSSRQSVRSLIESIENAGKPISKSGECKQIVLQKN